MFDEQTGEPIQKRGGRSGQFEPRRVPPPCESFVGCKKGHWKDRPDLNAEELATVDLYYAAKATSGACLNDRERSDWWLTETFARMREIEDRAAEIRMEAMMIRVASVGSIK